MISFSVHGDFSAELSRRLAAISGADPLPLAEEIRRIVVEENERGLREGTDSDGSPADELRPSTIERKRGGYGPPRIPRFASSRLISGFECVVGGDNARGYRITAGWPGLDFVRFIDKGTSRMSARPVSGLRPTTIIQVREAAMRYARSLVEGRG